MCLTLTNALAVLEHHDRQPPRPGYTRTRHHIGHIGPGDWWFPDQNGQPHTVTELDHRNGRIVLVDQYGVAHQYPHGSVVGTAVPDPRVRAGAARQLRGHAA